MLYIRHGKKVYSNGGSVTYPLDPPIVQSEYRDGGEIFSRLIARYGIPKCIVASPFLRTRQTSEILRDTILRDTGISVPIVIDRNIGEYLGNATRYLVPRRGESPGDSKRYVQTLPFTTQTAAHRPIFCKNPLEYHQLAAEHVEQCRNVWDTWYVTHGLFIQNVMSIITEQSQPYPDTLCGFIIKPDNTYEFI